ncbi:phosphoadenylyl-sulfate reductase [Oleiagrimonas sp. C23AA]|uniref:phosphoadenylyl-sulfate reductase n=1 Tax=Oleiagrimonas sp. C23AA TaxID=2719047 RepID=UPI00141F195C|nr:phosphoadenylyl-sulfate reductase [Oleiagrimonas sp. C23AA]NII11497.1 phosphoadenylyl-sulfate reductase [Oleiagrimonas sp. C23AA]
MSAREVPAHDAATLARLNQMLASLSAAERVGWALRHLPGTHVLSSSFGAQAAASLHLLTRQRADIPVILIDTGYLFAETYRFVDTLRQRLDLNLHIGRPHLSPGWLEARHGALWEKGEAGLDRYNRLAKVEPMQAMLEQLHAGTWFAGLRRHQSASRAETPFVTWRNGRFKMHPIADWTDRDIGRYLAAHDLPYHPLWDQGYVSIGDTHTTRPLSADMSAEDTRFFGLKRECGLHVDV